MRVISPCKGHQPVWGQSRVIHANCSLSAINRCDKQPALATGDIMKVWLCKRLTDNNAIGNYRAALYWISAVQNELRLAGHTSPLLKCLLLLSFVIVSGSSGGWMRWGHVSNPHLFCITMQLSPPAADPSVSAHLPSGRGHQRKLHTRKKEEGWLHIRLSLNTESNSWGGPVGNGMEPLYLA